MKKYKIKKTKKLVEQLKPFWKKQKDLTTEYFGKLFALELEMEKITSIKGINFFFCDNSIVGIGNVETNMELILSSELEEK